jgi:hypothetical protein
MRPSDDSAGDNVTADVLVTLSSFAAATLVVAAVCGMGVAGDGGAALRAARRLSHHALSSFRSA